MVKNAFPVNKANPLIEIPKNIPQIGFLGGEQGKEINDSIRKDYKDFGVLKVGNYFEEVIEGSNPFYVVAVQDRLSSGINVASQADLENAMRINVMDFRGTYEDTGLVLRTGGEPNGYLARNLMKQVKERGLKRMPIMIPLRDLTLKIDQDSPYGLSFLLRDNPELIYASILGKKDGFFVSTNEETGLPKKLGAGDRRLWTRQGGLSGLCLNRNLNLISNNDSLGYSDDVGRVVLVSTAEGGSQTFLNEKLIDLQKQKEFQITKINKKYEEALKILNGK